MLFLNSKWRKKINIIFATKFLSTIFLTHSASFCKIYAFNLKKFYVNLQEAVEHAQATGHVNFQEYRWCGNHVAKVIYFISWLFLFEPEFIDFSKNQ